MTERKAKRGFSALLLAGIIFTCMGVIYIAVIAGMTVFHAEIEGDIALFWLIFGGMGLVFLAAGIICLAVEMKKRIRSNRLVNAGKYITAEIAEINICYNVSVNRRHPYIVLCRYQDTEGNVHLFKSRYLYFDPEPLLTDRMVRVYVEDGSFKHYYVDIDAVLPNVVVH